MIDRLAFWIFLILFVGLILRNWKGANTLLSTSFVGGNQVLKTLQN